MFFSAQFWTAGRLNNNNDLVWETTGKKIDGSVIEWHPGEPDRYSPQTFRSVDIKFGPPNSWRTSPVSNKLNFICEL